MALHQVAEKDKDYYRILGVERTAGKDEIRQAFRRLARRFHPDSPGAAPDAEDRFKLLNEAYTVLSDREKRRRYDTLGEKWDEHEPISPFTPPPESKKREFSFAETSFSEFFKQHFGSQTPAGGNDQAAEEARGTDEEESGEARSGPATGRGADIEATVVVTPREAKDGTVKPISLRVKVVCSVCDGKGGSCPSCKGSGKRIRKREYQVKIPGAIASGARLRLKGKGEASSSGQEPGDLFLTIRVGTGGMIQQIDGEMVYPLDLAPWEAVLGTRITIATPKGSARIDIPPGTPAGHRFFLAGHGPLDETGKRADLVVTTQIQIPPRMTKTEYALWKEIARCTKFCPRESAEPAEKGKPIRAPVNRPPH